VFEWYSYVYCVTSYFAVIVTYVYMEWCGVFSVGKIKSFSNEPIAAFLGTCEFRRIYATLVGEFKSNGFICMSFKFSQSFNYKVTFHIYYYCLFLTLFKGTLWITNAFYKVWNRKLDSERWIWRDVEVVVACLRNNMSKGRLKQDGTCTKYYFQSSLKTKGYHHFMHAFIMFVWVCDIFCETCDVCGLA